MADVTYPRDGRNQGLGAVTDGVSPSPVVRPDPKAAHETANQVVVTTTVTVQHDLDAPSDGELAFLARSRLALAARSVMDDDKFAAFVRRAEVLLDDPPPVPEALRASPPGPREWLAILPALFGLTPLPSWGSGR